MTKNMVYSVAVLLFNSITTSAQLGDNVQSYASSSTAFIPPRPKEPIEYDKLGLKGYENRFFYDDKYHKGELWTTDKHFTTEMQYRFDQVSGSVQVKLPNGKEILLDENTIIMFHLFIQEKDEDKKIIFVQEKLPFGNKKALLQMLYFGTNFRLLRDSRKKQSFNLYYETADTQLHYTYYISQSTKKPLREIELTEKSLAQIFPTKQTKIKQFFKSNKSKEKLSLTKIVQLMTKIDEAK
jgi:hypothetical protein